MTYHLYYLFTIYAVVAMSIPLVPALKKWHGTIIYTTLGIFLGLLLGVVGFFIGGNLPCDGAFCNVGVALLSSIVGFIAGIVLTVSFLRSLKLKDTSTGYRLLIVLNYAAAIIIIIIVHEVLRQQHIDLLPALLHWYIPSE